MGLTTRSLSATSLGEVPTQATRVAVFDAATRCAATDTMTVLESRQLVREDVEAAFAELEEEHGLTNVGLRFVEGDVGLRAVFEPIDPE